MIVEKYFKQILDDAAIQLAAMMAEGNVPTATGNQLFPLKYLNIHPVRLMMSVLTLIINEHSREHLSSHYPGIRRWTVAGKLRGFTPNIFKWISVTMSSGEVIEVPCYPTDYGLIVMGGNDELNNALYHQSTITKDDNVIHLKFGKDK